MCADEFVICGLTPVDEAVVWAMDPAYMPRRWCLTMRELHTLYLQAYCGENNMRLTTYRSAPDVETVKIHFNFTVITITVSDNDILANNSRIIPMRTRGWGESL